VNFPKILLVLQGHQVRGFAPIGTLEFWNIGILGSGIVEWWVSSLNVDTAFFLE
jgi:hypothetical protein